MNSNPHCVLRAITVLKEDEKYIVVGFRHLQKNVQNMKHANTMSTIMVELTIKVKTKFTFSTVENIQWIHLTTDVKFSHPLLR